MSKMGKSELEAIHLARGLGHILVIEGGEYVYIGGFAERRDWDQSKIHRSNWSSLVRSKIFVPSSSGEPIEVEGIPYIRTVYRLNMEPGEGPELNTTKTEHLPAVVQDWDCTGIYQFSGSDGEVTLFDCGTKWRFAWQVGERLTFGFIPKDFGFPLVLKCDFRETNDQGETPNTLDKNPWKTLRSLCKWLADIPSITVEFDPQPLTATDEAAFRAAWKSFAVRHLSGREGGEA